MAGRLIMYKGLPGCGKSTAAREEQGKDPKHVVIVNKDDIRLEMKQDWNLDVEKEVLRKRDFEVSKALSKGLTVISDDTNFAKVHQKRLRELAKKYKSVFEVRDFSDVPLDVCLQRNAARFENDPEQLQHVKVPEAVIKEMAAKYVAVPVQVLDLELEPYVRPMDTPEAILCDLDGTLCLHNGRSPYEYEKCDTDLPNKAVVKLVQDLDQLGVTIVYLSGREDSAREKTEVWIQKHVGPVERLLMRRAGDYRKDSVVKLELFNEHVREQYDVRFVLDDRDQVVKLWRQLGLTCLQVAEGAF